MEFASRTLAVVVTAAFGLGAVMAGPGGCKRRGVPAAASPAASAIAGRVVSGAGAPLALVEVQAIPAPAGADDAADRDPLAVARAGADGNFRVSSLPPGRYLLRARAPGHAEAEALVAVRAGEETRATLTLPRGETLRGDVADARGPVGGARVLALPVSGRPADAITDADGRFAIERLPAGKYRLLVEVTGYTPAEPPPVEIPHAPVHVRLEGARWLLAGQVLAAGAPAAGARVRLGDEAASSPRDAIARADGRFQFAVLGAGGMYAVRATHGALSSPTVAGIKLEGDRDGAVRPPVRLDLQPAVTVTGRVVDDKGQGMRGASVRIARGADDPLPELADAGADGRFQAGPLPPGDYSLVPRRAGYVARRVVTARLAVGPAPPPFTLELVRGAALAGRVVDGHGAPAAAAVVRCLAAGVEDLTVLTEPLPPAAEAAALPPGMGRALGTTRTVRTDAAGRFEIADLVPGRFRIEVARAGAMPLQTGDLALGPGQRLDAGTLTLRDGIGVEGRVVGEDGTPVAGARVAVQQGTPPADTGLYAITDVAGRFTFALGPGRYALSAAAAGLADRAVPVDVAEAAHPPPLDIKLARADGALEGIVKDEGGRPLARARVVARTADPLADEGPAPLGRGQLGSAVTDAGGHFTIARVPRRALLVEVRHPDYPIAERAATPGTLAVVTVPIPGRVDGEVRERITGAVVARARVEASGPDGRTATASMARGRGGGFTLPRLAPGRWRLRATAPGFLTAEREVEVPSSPALGEASVRDLRLELDVAR